MRRALIRNAAWRFTGRKSIHKNKKSTNLPVKAKLLRAFRQPTDRQLPPRQIASQHASTWSSSHRPPSHPTQRNIIFHLSKQKRPPFNRTRPHALYGSRKHDGGTKEKHQRGKTGTHCTLVTAHQFRGRMTPRRFPLCRPRTNRRRIRRIESMPCAHTQLLIVPSSISMKASPGGTAYCWPTTKWPTIAFRWNLAR